MKDIYYVPDSFTPYYLKLLFAKKTESIWVVNADEKSAYNLKENLAALAPNIEIYILTPPETFEDRVTSDSIANRALFFEKIAEKIPAIFVSSLEALKTPPPSIQSIRNKTFIIKKDERFDYEGFKSLLNQLDYCRVGIVDRPGTYSLRGDIVDIFPFDKSRPYRIFLDEDLIERISELDPFNMSSIKEVDHLEFSIFSENEIFSGQLQEYLDNFEGMIFIDAIERTAPSLDLQKIITLFLKKGNKILRHIEKSTDAVEINVQPVPLFNNSLKSFVDFIVKHEEIKDVIIYTKDQHYRKRLISIIQDSFYLGSINISIKVGKFSEGFIYPPQKIIILSEELIYQRITSPVVKPRTSDRLFNIEDLRPGDYVVHLNFGIGKFIGLEKLPIDGKILELLKIEYAERSYLYLPHYQIDLLSKYTAISAQPPRLSNLSTQNWYTLREKARKSIKEFTTKLLMIESQRKLLPALRLPKYDILQREFEARFEYEETPDQLKAIYEIKRDMEKGVLIERLICGDSGVGKTEVALRALSKTVFAGYQGVFVAPTVILAKQHYENLVHRFSEFPVKIVLLTRLINDKQLSDVANKIANGDIDIVVGTHKVFSKKINFHNLGIVIIDEEHRFGVAQKEYFKQYFKNINILYLSATPIPRTLYQSLSGLRQMSIIQDIPPGRKPVGIFIYDFNESIIRHAIEKELNRGGQVFYVHNRITNLPAIVNHLQQLVPRANIEYIHGRMDRTRILNTIYKFAKNKIDVLVSTNIIELGLDFPNANTIIIEGIEKMGFAQLYQLRGRVGRGIKQGYAYMFFSRNKYIPNQVKKKYLEFAQYSQYGGGFKIALKDLEIRGAGNLLGTEQKGHINHIGFELYNQLLQETIRELKGQPVIETKEIVVDIGLEAYIPDEYVTDLREKIILYIRIAHAKDVKELENLSADFKRIYGRLSPPFENLFIITKLKLLCRKAGIQKIFFKNNTVLLETESHAALKFLDLTNARIIQDTKKIIIEIKSVIDNPYKIVQLFK